MKDKKWRDIPKDLEYMRSDVDMFESFMDNFVQPVIGHERYADFSKKDLRNLVTISDEAFARLCIENYADFIQCSPR